GQLEFVFFFSSRRRHTRFSRDWSSDVCSSDLFYNFEGFAGKQMRPGLGRTVRQQQVRLSRGISLCVLFRAAQRKYDQYPIVIPRSEERRVGKECRSRWCRSHGSNSSTATSEAR